VAIFYRIKPAGVLLTLPNACIKRLLSDGFNMTAITKFSHEEP